VPSDHDSHSVELILARYGLGAAMLVAGIVPIAANPGGFGADGFAMALAPGAVTAEQEAEERRPQS
jgi:hypothetical protein